MTNLFAELPTQLPNELVDVLAESQQVRIERIVSTGHSSPEGFWYDQDENEWVVVLSGEARLRLDGEAEPIRLTPGDHIDIPAHRRHRVESTTPDEPTVWLAVFYQPLRNRAGNYCLILWLNAPRSTIPTAERSATYFPLVPNCPRHTSVNVKGSQ